MIDYSNPCNKSNDYNKNKNTTTNVCGSKSNNSKKYENIDNSDTGNSSNNNSY